MATKTVYVSKDASAIKDTAASAFDGWSGFDDHHPVGTNGNYKWRSFLYFPISWAGMTGIVSATLHIRASTGYHFATLGSSTLHVRRMTKSWSEGSDRGENVWSQSEDYNWTNRATNDSYTAAGAATKSMNPGDNSWQTVTITDIVKAWAPTSIGGGGAANYGVILFNDDESSTSAYLEFWTDEYDGSSESSTPYVTVEYSTNVAPNAPSTTTMEPGTTNSGSPELVNSLTPVFGGVFTDPDLVAGSGDGITGAQVILYDNTTQVWDSGTVATTTENWTVPYTGPALTGNKVYNWKARQKDLAGAWSAYSGLMYFKANSIPMAPVCTLTEASSDVATLTPQFNITHNDPDTSDNKAYQYSITIETASGTVIATAWNVALGTPVATVQVTYGSGSLTGAPALVPGQQYRWQAATADSNGAWSSASAYQYFTVHKTATPVGLDPVSGDTVTTLTPVLAGQRGSTIDTLTEVTIEVYEPSVSTVTPKDTKVVTVANGVSFAYTWAGQALVSGNSYQWRVKAKTTAFGYGDFSALIPFAVDTSGINLRLNSGSQDPVTKRATTLTPNYTLDRGTSFRYYSVEVRTMAGALVYFSGDVDAGSSGTSFTRTHNATTGIGAGGAAASTGALAWNTQYQMRARASNASIADLQSQGYSSYTTFMTDAAGIPTLTGTNIDGAWTTSATPALGLTRAGTDTIATAQVRVYRVVGGTPVLVWDSGTVDVVDGTTASITYAGTTLTGGYTYQWEARYTKTTGPIGDWSPRQTWYQNAAPAMPTALEPASGAAVSGINPTFKATFYDDDIATKGDTPSQWVIVILNENDSAFNTVTRSTDLNVGPNEYTYGEVPNLVVGSTYKWYTYFVDSKGVAGAASATRTFKASNPPSCFITGPSDESTVASNRVTFTYDYTHASSTAQAFRRLVVKRTTTPAESDDPSQDVLVYDSGDQPEVVAAGFTGEVTMPSGFSKSGFRYRAYLYVIDNDGVKSATDTQEFVINVNAPPAMDMVQVSPDDARSRIRIQWTPAETSEPTKFGGYRMYRRLPGEDDFHIIADVKSWLTRQYYDYYAGNNIEYEYMVTQLRNVDDDTVIESPDSEIGLASLSQDEWVVIGADRAAMHIFTLPVQEEEHERPVQQEIFEPVGSSRKVIARGAVLGNEGSLDLLWAADEVRNARIQIEYLYANRGPHILKSPFGDVFEVEFAGPTHKYALGGHLAMSLSYIETSMRTSDLTYLQHLDNSVVLEGTVV